MRSRQVRWFTAAFAGYAVVTAILLRPVLAHLTTSLPHDLGDPVLISWVLWWNARHVPFTAAWWDAPFFYPLHGMLALSDHRVALSAVSSPMLWLGGTPPLAYNVLLLLSYPLSALSAHLLVWRLTGRHAGGVVAGAIFGFTPYRVLHVEHLELLAAFWLPIALLALHEYAATRHPKWAALFAVALILQALTAGYYFVYAAPLLALWLVWFLRRPTRRDVIALGLASAAAALALAPVLLEFRRVQDALNLTRSYDEIAHLSADITGLLAASPLAAWWRSRPGFPGSEGRIFPGAIALALFVAALAASESAGRNPSWLRRARAASAALLAAWIVFTIVAAVAPFSFTILGLPVTISQPIKPASIAAVFAVVLILTNPRVRNAWRHQSAIGFYAAAAVLMWLLALGPQPTAFGHRVVTRGPYALLMYLPAFSDRLRVPARFAMLMALALAVVGGLFIDRLLRRKRRRVKILSAAAVVAAVIVDGWIRPVPMLTAPAPVALPAEAAHAAAVVELPLGDPDRDAAAMYHAIAHGRPVINGYSGYGPAHYQMLMRGLNAGDPSALHPFAERGPILAVVDTTASSGAESRHIVEQQTGATTIAVRDGRLFFWIPRRPAGPIPARGAALTIRAAAANTGTMQLQMLTDGALLTRWQTSHPQDGSEQVTFDVGFVDRVGGVSLALGPFVNDAPRALDISTSMDGRQWDTGWSGGTAAAAIEAALANPYAVPLTFHMTPRSARFVRLRQTARAGDATWSIAEATIWRAP